MRRLASPSFRRHWHPFSRTWFRTRSDILVEALMTEIERVWWTAPLRNLTTLQLNRIIISNSSIGTRSFKITKMTWNKVFKSSRSKRRGKSTEPVSKHPLAMMPVTATTKITVNLIKRAFNNIHHLQLPILESFCQSTIRLARFNPLKRLILVIKTTRNSGELPRKAKRNTSDRPRWSRLEVLLLP